MSNPTVSPLMQSRQVQALEWFVSVETGSLAGRRFPITSSAGSLTLGREGDCTIRFDPQRERMVGRHHARIEVRADGVYLVDTHSANGTFKDGEAVSEVRLQHGDRFQLGGEVEGAPGPWVAIHMPVAVHLAPMAPMASDAATLVIRPGQSGAAAPPSRAPDPGDAVHAPPVIATPPPAAKPVTPPTPATPSLPLLYSQPPISVAEPPRAAVARRDLPVAAVDPLHSQRRAQLFWQVAMIVLLLVMACGVGAALGLRNSSDADSEPELAAHGQ